MSYIKKITIILLLFLLSACSMTIGPREPLSYEDLLFDTSYVHTIDVEISEEDWNSLLKIPTEKVKYHVNVTVDGERFEDVAFASKGNISLTTIARKEEIDRYSFKINFTKFTQDNDYHGLNRLHLNNGFCDATYMKDYLSYRIISEAGIDTPLVTYVWLTINGEDFGLFQAIEEVGKSWLKRTGLEGGELYKPESRGAAGGTRSVTLVYRGDEIDKYAGIFAGSETNADDDAKRRVIAAIKALNEQVDLDKYLEADEIIRYFVGHNFVCNYDSYTGRMLHNFYLYEKDGKLSIYPWDYNFSFGGFRSGGTDMSINKGIDSPMRRPSDTEDRPLWVWIVDNEQYLARYHELFNELLRSYFESGRCEQEIETIYRMIRPYVDKDPTAFYSVEDLDKAISALKTYCLKRSQSIRKQLNGELATSYEDQNEEDRIPKDDLNIMDMGFYGTDRFSKKQD